ncbi:MAG TPA: GlsB/YeaQ/YmgE family stress response membrane protein [Stellaceae bacterium]|nr:GlsB/YeaQ/YmgE family stress response membrane protein [Stellaceae bacterium]
MMHGGGILILLLVGLVAGWLAGQIVRGRGFGLVGDLVVGVVGAFIGSWLFGALGIFIGMGLIGEIISATIGAVILVAIIRLVRRV